MAKKTFIAQVKDLNLSDDGKGRVVFATLNVIDKDGDVTLPGAFGSQLSHLLPMHIWQDADTPFIGVANIGETTTEAYADIELNLDLQRARDWRSSLKFALDRGKTIEWSYGFDVLDSEAGQLDGKSCQFLKKMVVHEVSPVVVGAGVNTRTLAMKGLNVSKKAYAEISGTWEEIQCALYEALEWELLGDLDGYVSIEGTFDNSVIASRYIWDAPNPDDANTYWSFDWALNADGTVTLSNRQAVALAVQAQIQGKGLRMADHVARVLGRVEGLTDRCKALAALRKKEGRTLSQANRDRLNGMLPHLNQVVDSIQGLLDNTSDAEDDSSTDADEETEKALTRAHGDFLFKEFERTLARIGGQQ